MINRPAVIRRHTIRYQEPHLDAPLTVGNGEFAFTADVTGLQTFTTLHEREAGRQAGRSVMPLGTQAQWGYHWAPNPEGWTLDDTMESYPGPRGPVSYPTAYDYTQDRSESVAAGRGAGYYYWTNPQRLHLAQVGFVFDDAEIGLEDIEVLEQSLDLLTGLLDSRFRYDGHEVRVCTAVDPDRDALAVTIETDLLSTGRACVQIAFPYVEESWEAPPVWSEPDAHTTETERSTDGVTWRRRLDEARYTARLSGVTGDEVVGAAAHRFEIRPAQASRVEFVLEFGAGELSERALTATEVLQRSARGWGSFWDRGAAVDLSGSTDQRWRELERRIVLSQYQTAVNCAGSTPPQESGLVCNSWGGTFHLEMHWWHAAHFVAWGRGDLLERSLGWYSEILDGARRTAREQGYQGARWPKHVGPEGIESPNVIGPLLVWQQPHPIHFAEALYLARGEDPEVLRRYQVIVEESAEFLASFAVCEDDGTHHLPPPLVPAQEVYGLKESWDPPFEVAYVRWALEVAGRWQERLGRPRPQAWEDVRRGLVPEVAAEGWYEAVQRPPRSEFTDHPAVLGALGVVPDTGAVDHKAMSRTLDRVLESWHWPSAWGWDFPMIAMCATRLGRTEVAIDSLLRTEQKNLHLPNGHNPQARNRLPLYLPGNGGLLIAAALLLAGWVDHEGRSRVPELPEGWHAEIEGFPARP